MSSAFELLQTMGKGVRPQQAVVAEQGIHEGRWTRDQVAAFFELPERDFFFFFFFLSSCSDQFRDLCLGAAVPR